VSLEDAFWRALEEIASERDMTRAKLISAIDSKRQQDNLSSAIRLFVWISIASKFLSANARRTADGDTEPNAAPEIGTCSTTASWAVAFTSATRQQVQTKHGLVDHRVRGPGPWLSKK
jgi:Ribbon-helix-helix domain